MAASGMADPSFEPAPSASGVVAPITYLLVDGENLDATLGVSVLGHRPSPEQRPRWERLLDFAERTWGQPVKGLFFINASSGSLPMSFVQALQAIGFRPVPLSGPPGMKVVDVGIQRTLEAIRNRPGNVLLGSHDGDFIPQVEALLTGDRKVGLVAFGEFVNLGFTALKVAGLEIFDLEYHVRAFNQELPRLRIVGIDEFDPELFL